MNQVTTFNFNGTTLRILGTPENPEFLAREIAAVLGYSDTQAMTRRLDDDEVGSCPDNSSGQVRVVSTITESGLYSSILGSSKPEAKAFKKLVTGTILPTIRKTGMYATDTLLDDPELFLKTVTKLSEERKLRLAAEATAVAAMEHSKTLEVAVETQKEETAKVSVVVERQNYQLAQHRKLEDALRDLFTDTKGLIVGDAAKFFLSRGYKTCTVSALRNIMQERGWLSKGKSPTAMATHLGNGNMVTGGVVTNHITGWSGEARTPKITSKGMARLAVNLPLWGFTREDAIKSECIIAEYMA